MRALWAGSRVWRQDPTAFKGTRWEGGNVGGEGPGDYPTDMAVQGGQVREPEAADTRNRQ